MSGKKRRLRNKGRWLIEKGETFHCGSQNRDFGWTMSGFFNSHPKAVAVHDAGLDGQWEAAPAPIVSRRVDGRLITTIVVFSLVLGLLAAFAPSFFRLNNFINILVQTSTLAILAIGMSFVMIGGGIDLSMPANMAMSAVLGALYMHDGHDPVTGSAIMILSGAMIGALNGVAVAYLRMIPFVVTLATMTIVKGACIWLTNSVSIAGLPESFGDVLLARPLGIPVAVLVTIALTLLASTALSFTVIGHWLYAVGVNERAARVARVPIEQVTAMSYAAAGLSAGVAAVLLAARLDSASANMGNDGVVLDIVSACVVGGISIYGGIGRAYGAVLGALFITIVSNGLNLMGVSFYLGLIVKGIVIIGYVALDGLSGKAR
jgi:ribose/xylose/arabinose/galactoside ABC-type transport system permease subunit